jgi:hypothetical protein
MEHDRVAMSPCLEFLSEIQPNTKPWEDNDDGSGYKEIRDLEETVKKIGPLPDRTIRLDGY